MRSNDSSPTDDWLTNKQAAQVIGINFRTLKRWEPPDGPAYYRFGSRGDRRYRRDDIEQWLEERRVG